MEFLIWVIIAIIIGAIKRASKGEGYPKLPRGFPKLPDGWDDTPLGPGGHRRHGEWPPKKVSTEQPTVPRQGQPMTMGRPGEPMSTGRPGQSMTGYPVPGPGQRDPSHDSPGPTYEGRETEGRGEMEGRSEYETKEPVAPTLLEPHETVRTTIVEPHETVRETVQVSTTVRPDPDYRNEKRAKPSTDTERAFSGQSAYDRIGSHPVGRPARKPPFFSIQKGDLVRAVIMAEILGPPRGRKPRSDTHFSKLR